MTSVWKTPLILLLIISTLTLGAVYGARLPDDYRCLRVVTGSNYGAGFDEANLGYALFDRGSGQYRDDPRANPPLRLSATRDSQHEAELVRALDGSYTLWIRDPDGESVALQTGIAPAMILRNANFLVSWSPDSSRIAYLWAAKDGKIYLSTATADGSHRRSALFTRSDGAPQSLFDVRVYGWSADNAVIAIAEGRADWTNSYAFWSAETLARIDRVLEPLYRGVWSPQGQKFAAIHTAAGRQSLKLLTLNAENRAEIVVDALPKAPIELIAWSPDSRYVVLMSFASICAAGRPCTSHWRYDFYDSAGLPLQTNVIGARLSQGGTSDMDTPPSGRTVTASWFGSEWWYLNGSGELVALEVGTGATRVIAAHIIEQFGDEIFYVSDWQRSRMWAVSNFTLLPDSDSVIVPTQQGDKIRVELISSESRQTLVEDADTLFSRSENGSRFWLWGGTWAVIPWSKRGDSTRLTLAHLGTDFTRTIDGGYETISSIYAADRDWIGYIGRRGSERALEIANVQTGERRRLLNSLEGQPFWDMAFNRSAISIFIRSGRDALFRGLVYVVSADDRAKRITNDAVNVPIWSPDGVDFALMRLDSGGNAVLEILGHDGTARQQINLGQFLASQPALDGWTRCD